MWWNTFRENGVWQPGWPKQPNNQNLYIGCRSVKSLESYHHNLLPEVRLNSDSPQISSNAGDIINTEHGFTIQLDTKYYQPRDIQIILYHHSLSVIGDRLEDDGTCRQRLRRRFTRKYTIPSDIRLSSVSSHLTNNGCLIIKGSRKGWKETDLTEHLASSLITNESKMSAV